MNHRKNLARAFCAVAAVALGVAGLPAASAQYAYDSDDDGPSRVARISYISGDVSVLDSQGEDWERADVNMPLFEGSEIYAGPDARAEIGLGGRSFLRISNGADVSLAQFSDGWAQISVASGTAVLSTRSGNGRGETSISAPAAAVTPTSAGLYRVDVADNGDTWVTINDGTADVSTLGGSFEAYAGDVASIGYDDANDIDVAGDAARWNRDEFDDWVGQRDDMYETYYRRDQPRDVLALDDRDDIFGIAELARYGTWLTIGNVSAWQPQYARDPNWSPYQDGYWDYSPVTGYTWISSEPWGWAPYHYGRWSFDDRSGWLWLPSDDTSSSYPAYQTARYRWKPALVYFWQPAGANDYAWVPLAPGERYVPFSTSAYSAKRTSSRQTVTTFRPKNLEARRGIVVASPTALATRQKPQRVARDAAERVAPPTATQVETPAVAVLPTPVQKPATVAPARVRPTTAVRQRAVVVDQSAEAKAPKPKTQVDATLRTQRQAERTERRAARQQLRVERQAAAPSGAAPTTTPQQASPSPRANPRTAPGQPGRRGGRKADAATGASPTVTPRGATPTTTATPRPGRRTPPAETTTPPARVTPDVPGATVTETPGNAAKPTTDATPPNGRGQRKNKNKKNRPNGTEQPPADSTPPPATTPPQ